MSDKDTQTQNPNPNFNNQIFTPVKEAKPWWKSKTVWFNALATGAGLLANGLQAANDIAPIVKPFVNTAVFGKATVVIGVGNIILRALTHQPIKGGKGATEPLPAASQSEQWSAGRD